MVNSSSQLVLFTISLKVLLSKILLITRLILNHMLNLFTLLIIILRKIPKNIEIIPSLYSHYLMVFLSISNTSEPQ